MKRTFAVLSVSVVLGSLLAGCGEEDDARPASTPAPASEAPAAEGTGYTFQPPEGFRDVTSRFDGTAIKVDLAFVDTDATRFATNIAVIREQPGGRFDVDDLVPTVTRQAEMLATDAGISKVEDRELDGVPAKTYAFMSRDDHAGPVRQRQVVAVKDGAIYTITWSVPAEEFEAQEETLDRALASWRWS